MRKLRSDCKLAGMLPEDLALIDEWLFEKELSYEEVHRRAQEWLKFTGSISSLKRYYHHR